MSGTKGIVDEYVAQAGVSLAQIGIVLLLALVQAYVFQHNHFTGSHIQAGLPVGNQAYRLAQQGGQALDHRGQAVFRLGFAFGRTAQVGHQDDAGTGVQAVFDGRQAGADAGVVADHAIFHRHVHVNTDQYAFAGQVQLGQFVEFHRWLAFIC